MQPDRLNRSSFVLSGTCDLRRTDLALVLQKCAVAVGVLLQLFTLIAADPSYVYPGEPVPPDTIR